VVISLRKLPLDVIELPNRKLLHPFPVDDSWESIEYTFTDVECKKEFMLIEKKERWLDEFV